MPRWIEVTLRVDGEAAEAAAELLARYGYQGIAVEHEGIPPDKLDEDELPPPSALAVRAYLALDAHSEALTLQLEQGLRYLNMMYPMPQPEYQIVDEADWAEAWKAHYHPVRLGRRIVIRPLWVELETQPDDVVIALDPGMAFGTGTHPTTQLCLEAAEDVITEGARVLDLGTGSGILAIGAAKLGAGHVLALDNDAIAVEAALENIAQNHASERITVRAGSLPEALAEGAPFDVLLVNILARIIIQMCGEGLGDALRPGGVGVFSGIIDTQSSEVEAALRAAGLTPYARRQQGDWVAIEARR